MTMTSAASRTCLAIVLAAGEGKRMRSSKPKVLHEVGNRSMVGHVLAAVKAAGADAVAVVVGPGRDDVAAEARAVIPDALVFTQVDRLGTAHAVLAAREALARGFDDVIVAFADTPLVTAETFARMRKPLAQGVGVVALGFEAADPAGYGRLVVEDGELDRIVEHKDANEAERDITLCNAGLISFDGRSALDRLARIGNANAQGEYYLTDMVTVARGDGASAVALVAPEEEVQGVNDRRQLSSAEAVFQRRMRDSAMIGGATLIAPDTVFFSADTVVGQDVMIEPHVVFGPKVSIADGAVIHAFSHLEGARVGPKATVGPFARLRPGADLAAKAKVGNFVEIKAATLGEGAKVSHLTYIGDAEIGADANIGAGTITCNYDGFLKYKTIIGKGAFVGSNSSLVAPVTIGDGAYVGSGSVITSDVAPDSLAVARGRQMQRAGWAATFRARKAEEKAALKK
ncbi:MAG: bifunctional UDP-N-acetylglucosamine diphosphorylase/glucosamine-1-phosphate N-acetyltransferase GlmU [Bosea sp. (in: a-proteobacteria)]